MPLKPINTKHRLEELKHNPRRAFYFALITLKGRWPEAEPYIMKDASAAVNYSHEILKFAAVSSGSRPAGCVLANSI